MNEKIGKNRLSDPLSEVLLGVLSIVSLKLSDGGGILKPADLSYFISHIDSRELFI